MSPEEQRIKIAEACGWTDVRQCSLGLWVGKHPRYKPLYGVHQYVPNYPSDLNAMHEAEMWLKGDLGRREYGNAYPTFVQIIRREFGVSATAAQRAEAFLRTLNLWTK